MVIDELNQFLTEYSPHEIEGYKYYLNAMESHNMQLLNVVDLHYDSFPPNITLNHKYPLRFHRHERYCRRVYHTHTFVEIMYQYSGQCVQNIAGKTLLLHQGEFCIIPPGVFHSPDVYDESILINLLIEIDALKQLCDILSTSDELLPFFLQSVFYHKQHPKYLIIQPKQDPVLHRMMQEMIVEYFNCKSYMQEILYSQIVHLVYYMMRHHTENMYISDQNITQNTLHLKILQYIYDHYQTVCLSDLANRFSYSETYISKIIHKHTGISFSEHLIQIRINRAKILLITTDLSFSEIAECCGYQGDSYFHRTFKQVVGMTPIEYRQFNKLPSK